MRIKSKLLFGEDIKDQERVYDLVCQGKLPFGYYLLLCDASGELEYIPAFMQSSRYYASDRFQIIGVARHRLEADWMIADMVKQVYAEGVYPTLRDYVREVLGAEP